MKRKIFILLACAAAAAVCTFSAIACDKAQTCNGLKLRTNGDGYEIYGVTDATLTTADIPDDFKGKPITSVGKGAFDSNTALTSVHIPKSVLSLGDGAFYCCRSLTEAVLPNGLKSVGEWAFGGCQSLVSVYIPASVAFIGDYAFCYCQRLTSVTYGGTKAQWAAVSKGGKWDYRTGMLTVQCSDGAL